MELLPILPVNSPRPESQGNKSVSAGEISFNKVLRSLGVAARPVSPKNMPAEANLHRWRFEDNWDDDPDHKLVENPYDCIARICRNLSREKNK